MLRIPTFLFVILLHISSIRGDDPIENFPGFIDLQLCAKSCITGCATNGCPSGMFRKIGCDTYNCSRRHSALSEGLNYLADCISRDKSAFGCGSVDQQALAEAIVRGACRKEGYNVDDVPSGGTVPTRTADLPTPTYTTTGTDRVTVTVTAANYGSVEGVFFGNVLLLGIFAVSSVVIPALAFL